MTVSKMRPTDKPKAHREAVYRGRLRCRPRNLPRSRPVKSYRQAKSPLGCNLLRRTEKSTEKSTEKLTEMSTEKSTSKVYQVDQDSAQAAFRERNHEVDRMVTEADFQRRLPSQLASGSQCHLPMTTA